MEPQEFVLTPIEKQVNALLQEAGNCLQTFRSLEALGVLSKAHSLVETNDVCWQIKGGVYHALGDAHIQSGHLDEGITFFTKAHDTIEDKEGKASLAIQIANHLVMKGDIPGALKYTEEASQESAEGIIQSHACQIQGAIAVMQADYPRAIELLNKAAELAEQAHRYTDLAMVIMEISTCFMRMGKPETALSELYRAERYVKENHNLNLYMRFALRRAHLLYIMGRDAEAKELIIALDQQRD